MTVAKEMEVYESTATLDFNSFSVCFGLAHYNIGTRGSLATGGAMAAAVKIGRRIVPTTPL